MKLLQAVAGAIIVAVSICIATPVTLADTALTKLVGERLQAGQLKGLRDDLLAMDQPSASNEVLFALGVTEFLQAIEHLAASMYRHGLEPPRGLVRELPFFRLPVPLNPKPQPLTYEKMRIVFKTLIADLSAAEASLAKIGTSDVKLPVALGLVRLDLDGDGLATEEESLWRVFNATLGGGNVPEGAADLFIINFDRADVAWLRGYTHLLRAMAEFILAHDWQAGFDTSFHMIFPNASLPNATLDEYRPAQNGYFDPATVADLIAFIHLAHWPVDEPRRMQEALLHLEAMVELSRENWKFIVAETDDEAEWIPGPQQKNGALPGMAVTKEIVDGWMVFLDEFDALLEGRKLIPHWRFAKGINVRRVFTEPRLFDPILWAQGSAALPYLEAGPMTDGETWTRIMTMFEGNFLGYAVWFN